MFVLKKKTLLMGIAGAALLAAPVLAEGTTGSQGSDTLQKMDDSGAIGPTQPRSGPGVQGPPDTRTGPATRVPGGGEGSGAGSTGASSGESGAEHSAPGSTEHTTTPSQDSSGVQGFPDTRTGPATREPGDHNP